jgi:hypothetical protein
MIFALLSIALVLSGLWLAWFVARMQDQIDRHQIDEDES